MGIPNSKDFPDNNDGDDNGVTLESPPGADYVKIKGKHGNDQIFVHKGTDLWYFIEKIEGTINAKNYFLKRYPNLPPKLEKYLDALDGKYDKIYKKKGNVDSDDDTDNSESEEEEESDNEESESEEEDSDEDSGEDTGKAKLSDVGGIGDKVPSNGDQKKINEFEIASKLNQISNQQQLTKRNENGNSMSFKEFELNKKIEHEMIKDDNKPLPSSSSSTPQQIKKNLTTSDKKRPNLFQLADNRLLELFVLWKQTFQFENIIFDKIRLLQEERLEKQKIERATIISPPPLSSKSFTFVPMSPQNDDYNNISFGRKNTTSATSSSSSFENVPLSQDLDKYFSILVKWINENNNNIKVYNEGQKLYLEKVQLLHSEYARRYNENKKNYELLVNEKKTEKQMKMQEKIEMENKPLPPVPLIMTANNNNNNIQNQYQNVYPSFHTLNLANNNIVNQSLSSPPVQLHTTITITSSDEDFELPIDEDYMKYVNACFLNLDKWFFLKLKELDILKERQQLLFRKIMDQNLTINKDSSVILKKKPTSSKRRKPRVTRQQQQRDDDNSSSSEDEYSDDGENSNNIV